MSDQSTRGHNASRGQGGRGISQNGKSFMVHQLSHTPGGRYGYRKQLRREEAARLKAERLKRSASDQLAVLDARLGVGVGAVKERKRLMALIE